MAPLNKKERKVIKMASFGKIKYLYKKDDGTDISDLRENLTLPANTVNLQRITADGLENSPLTGDTEFIYDGNGDVALTAPGEIEKTAECTLLDADNIEVQKELLGENNVIAESDGGYSAFEKNHINKTGTYFVDCPDNDGGILRVIFVNARLSQSDAEEFVYNEAKGIPVTLSCESFNSTDGDENENGSYTIRRYFAPENENSAPIEPPTEG